MRMSAPALPRLRSREQEQEQRGFATYEPQVRTPTAFFVLLACVLAAAVGTSVGSGSRWALPLAALPVAAVWALALPTMGNGLRVSFMAAWGVLLFGYAFAGRGLAHMGASPIYVAEPVLGLGMLLLLAQARRISFLPLHWYLLLFMAWGLCRTVPYLATDGVDAMRDAVTWGYALFAIVISFAVRPGDVETIVRWFQKLAPLFLIWVPVLFLLNQSFLAYLPKAPGSEVQIPYFQPGDIGVHLAGIAAFGLLGLYSWKRKPAALGLVVLGGFWFADFLISGSITRGAFLAMIVAVGACYFFRPSLRWLPFAALGIAAIAIVALINPHIPVQGRNRSVSVQQAISNLSSVATDSSDPELEQTRQWRLQWWNKIIDYTVFGQYFWGGKGFGVNLADDDGFQVAQDHSLRSPHNTHLTVLARMGVPGLVMWLFLQGIFAIGLLKARLTSLAAGQRFRAGIITWLFVYWLAMMVNGCFTLYLESPQQGIWFWSVFGLGLAFLRDPNLGVQVERKPAGVRRRRALGLAPALQGSAAA